MFDANQNLRNWVINLGALPFPKWHPKTSYFGANFGQFRNLIANISGKATDIVERKTSVTNCKLSYVCLLNLVNIGPQTAKNGT